MSTIPSLSDQLRDATASDHDRLEALPFAAALAVGSLPIEGYIGYLRAMAVVHGVMEHELPIEADERIDAIWEDRMRRLPALQRDLAHFHPMAIGDVPAAQRASAVVGDRLLHRSVEAPISMLGYLYVLEGSILGAAVLGPQAERAFDLDDGHGCAYLAHDSATSGERWRAFRNRLDDLKLNEAERADILAAAHEAYDGIADILSALHPFDRATLVRSATSLNPEAGTHPIPQDPLELEAARRAGERCLLEFPYYVWRYGERGRRFTNSDGAWLVTLTKYPQARVDRQITWLGEVLATRGMPRILLQRHLELLFEELRLRLPEPHIDYDKLLRAANKLAADRRVYITDTQMDQLCGAFEQAIGTDWRMRLPGAGMIIISAVADEEAGLAGTLSNVTSWFSEPDRFPFEVIAAVRRLERDARAEVASRVISAGGT